MKNSSTRQIRVAIAGSGIAGMSAAWLLSEHCDVVVYEVAGRIGGHSNTIMAPGPSGITPVDMGFIVFNEQTYPNLTALFQHLGVETLGTDMSFAASLGGGQVEYNGENLRSLFAQRRNLLRPRFWSMLADLLRFYRQAPGDLDSLMSSHQTLGGYLSQRKYGAPFINDHLLPLAAAIWSAPVKNILDYPAASFIRFHENHGLLKLTGRPVWRTVKGASRQYVSRLTQGFVHKVRLNCGVAFVERGKDGILVRDTQGQLDRFDHIVFASQADQALAALGDPTAAERQLLSQFRYSDNAAWLHRDPSYMPKREAVWASWNYIERPGEKGVDPMMVTYWMNRLQHIPHDNPLFVTLNPATPPREDRVIHREDYRHPVFDSNAIAAQRRLWSLQGHQNTWFCGSYFGAGFHEDGLQSGLAVAEELAGVRRPWAVANESGRIFRNGQADGETLQEAA